ncbi:SAM-dependent methyltransferase [Streptomyces rhizosphaerihabitans]|uniref:SAM-dependent methyltransferase n=1 Tax=Streptomyces rhizosphaerihabitans TaxID=1266770 RepID=UPI0021BEACD0|nr:SAM-dependent methyltransferase [Streptomyces rhizosphaerihabitans]MCT9006279.1 SAM-dependent methyltransferase [Streptomyces rhizosphaerihabitans]
MRRAVKGEWHGWREATEEALYGPSGFYRGPAGPAGHFRTSVHASPLFAGAVARLLCRLDAALGHPDTLDFVDMAAGRGELVTGVLAALPADVASRARWFAVERADRPAGLDRRIAWLAEPPKGITGLLFANEWLDNVPVDVAEVGPDGVPRLVLVRGDGAERLGEAVTGADAQWLRNWWWPPAGARFARTPAPGARPDRTPPQGAPLPQGARTSADEPLLAAEGARAEIGLPRDLAWASAVSALDRGLAVAVDYAHFAGGRPPFGTLTGFREGRGTAPVPDGSCDITAHVALDACALPGGRVVTQRAALRALGVSGARPPLALASTDPAAYVRALAGAGAAAELTAPGGLGDFGWLLQPVGFPDVLRDVPAAADAPDALHAPAAENAVLRDALLVDVPDHEEQ